MNKEGNPNAFSANFLGKVEKLESETTTGFHAEWAGPWRIEKRGEEYAVLRESDGRVEALARHRDLAAQVAASLSTMAPDTRYCFEKNTDGNELGIDLKVIRESGGFTTVAKFRTRLDYVLEALKILENLLLSPLLLAYLLDAASPELLSQAGEILMRMIAERSGEEAKTGSTPEPSPENSSLVALLKADSEADSGTPKQVTK